MAFDLIEKITLPPKAELTAKVRIGVRQYASAKPRLEIHIGELVAGGLDWDHQSRLLLLFGTGPDAGKILLRATNHDDGNGRTPRYLSDSNRGLKLTTTRLPEDMVGQCTELTEVEFQSDPVEGFLVMALPQGLRIAA